MLSLKVLLASCVTLMKDMAIYCERTSTSFRDFEVYSKSNSEWRTILKEFQVIRSLYHLYQSNLSIRRARHSMLWKRGKRKTRDVWEEWLLVFCRNPPLQERKLEPKAIVIILEASETEKRPTSILVQRVDCVGICVFYSNHFEQNDLHHMWPFPTRIADTSISTTIAISPQDAMMIGGMAWTISRKSLLCNCVTRFSLKTVDSNWVATFSF